MSSSSTALQELQHFCRAYGITPEMLDEPVYDLMLTSALAAINETDDVDEQEQLLDEYEARASAINNEGISGQLEFLLTALDQDVAAAQDLLRQLIERR